MPNHPHIQSLYKIYLSETQPFRKVHRMIDLFETIIKTHTAVMMGEYFKHNQISDTAKGMLAAGLRTPSLGTWQLFSRELYKELKQAVHNFICHDFASAFEALDVALNKEKTNVISFRNGYAHGATPSDEQCENDIQQFEPFLNKLLSLQWLNESSIEALDGKVHLRNGTDLLNLHPIIAYRADETEQPFVFFNDLKNDKVGLLNYPLSKHYRDKSFFSEFNQYLPLQEWKKSGSNIFNQRIEELTETFKGRLIERTSIKNYVTTKQKGFLSIQGNPGIGKSALIAQMYKDLTNAEEKLPIQLVEYFIRRGTPQAEVSFLINHLLKKIDELFPAGKEIRAEGQTTWELQQQLHNKWTAFGETDSPFKIIFIIDGLDEGVENDILKYLPRETFNNILFMYGSRPGGHQQLDKFWGELPVEHHQKIELAGLSKEDIRALLYEVANKYEIDKDSTWIDYLQQRSQGNPLYLKLLCNAIEEGSIAINDVDALPKEIDDYYKAILQRYAQMPDGDHLLNSLFVFAAARDYLTPMHLSEILGFGPATQTNVMSTLVEVLYENPMTENVLDYQLFHESLREYLKKDRATEVVKAEQKIIEFCGRWKTLEVNYEQQYVLRHYASHLFTQQNEAHHLTLIALTKDAEFIATQKKVLRNFEATHQLYQYGIEIATKYNWNEAAIDCGLGIVDLKYEEQNDVTAILEMVKQNEIELALLRITALGGPSAEDKKRQFIVIMLCIMEFTLLESKTQPWRKNAIERLLGLMEEQIRIDHSVFKWNYYFSGYLMFLIAVELEKIGLSYIEIYNRTDKWHNDWLKNKGPYSDEQLDIIIQTAEGISDDFDKISAFKEIAVVLANQGKLEESSKLLEKSIQTAEGIKIERQKSSAFKEIAVVLANQGKLEESSKLLEKSIQTAEGISDDFDRSSAFKGIAVVLANKGEIEKSIQMAEDIKDDFYKSSAFNKIALVLANKGKLAESSMILEKSIQTAEGIKSHFYRSPAFMEIAVLLANQGEIEKSIQLAEDIKIDFQKSLAYKAIAVALANQGEIAKSIKMAQGVNDFDRSSAFKEIALVSAYRSEIEKSIEMAEGINDNFDKSSAFKEISLVLAKQGKLTESSMILEKSILTAEGIKTDWQKRLAFNEIAVVLLDLGKWTEGGMLLEKSIPTAKGINDDFDKGSLFEKIAIVFKNQGEIEKSIQIAQSIIIDWRKSSLFKEIVIALANQGEIDKSIHTAEGMNDDWQKCLAFNEIAVSLVNLGKLIESRLILEKLIQTVEDINDNQQKSSVFAAIAVALANKGNLEESSNMLEKSIQIAEDIIDDFDKSSAFREIAFVLVNLGEIDKSMQMVEGEILEFDKNSAYKEIAVLLANQGEIEKSLQIAEGINDDVYKTKAFKEIAVVIASQGNFKESKKILEKTIEMSEGIIDDFDKSSADKEIAVVLANQGKLEESSKLLEKSIQTAEGIKIDWRKNSAFKEITVVLANQGNLEEAINVMQKITSSADRMQAWVNIGKEFYEKQQFQNLNQTLAQLPNDEAITFFKKGIAQSITATNATEETILQILPLVKADKESTEHLLQMHALYCAFFEKTPKEKIQKFNRSLNIQWALDIIAKFPKEENVVRMSTNLELWIGEVGDEDDREQIELWAKQVVKGKMTEEEFGEKVKGMW